MKTVITHKYMVNVEKRFNKIDKKIERIETRAKKQTKILNAHTKHMQEIKKFVTESTLSKTEKTMLFDVKNYLESFSKQSGNIRLTVKGSGYGRMRDLLIGAIFGFISIYLLSAISIQVLKFFIFLINLF